MLGKRIKSAKETGVSCVVRRRPILEVERGRRKLQVTPCLLEEKSEV